MASIHRGAVAPCVTGRMSRGVPVVVPAVCVSCSAIAPAPNPCGTSSTASRAFNSARSFHRRGPIAAAEGNGNGVLNEDDIVRVACVGDVVVLHFECKDEDGNVLESSYAVDEPLMFEVGAGDMMGNRLFQGFDEAVRGMAVGTKTVLEASGGEWDRELMFTVPADHPEIERLQGRYKNQGGLTPGMVVELANGGMAMVVSMDDGAVKLDANNMMAGKTLVFELELLEIADLSKIRSGDAQAEAN